MQTYTYKRGFKPLSIMLALGFFSIVGTAVLIGKLPVWILVAYIGISVVTFIIYAIDKSAAKNKRWRIRENTLHLLSLAGGWPGAFIAQEKLRHKSKKKPFRLFFFATLFLNIGMFIWFLLESTVSSYDFSKPFQRVLEVSKKIS